MMTRMTYSNICNYKMVKEFPWKKNLFHNNWNENKMSLIFSNTELDYRRCSSSLSNF